MTKARQTVRKQVVQSLPPDAPAPRGRGQALVELALALPLILLFLLGGIEVSFLVSDKFSQDHDTAELADWAADRNGDPSWMVVADDLFADDCDVDVTGPDAYDIYHASSTCTYQGRVTPIFFDLPISSGADSAAPPSPTPTPTPTPPPTPTPTPTPSPTP